MTIPVIVASVVALAGLFLGLLPERHRRVPSLPLLALGPVLLLWLAILHGLEIASLWAVALSALYRAPLIHWARWLGARRRRQAGQIA